jgi:hypothetical protein
MTMSKRLSCSVPLIGKIGDNPPYFLPRQVPRRVMGTQVKVMEATAEYVNRIGYLEKP